ncbi:unnamed protein product [Mytilus edulis]|uniref:Uncharacterized protein n=1 Tax=Mytilus edulis TaxID=6550 RepID=A0A8S3RXK2_MYTED|nr:unnamed protein product [Mytilus edulis]
MWTTKTQEEELVTICVPTAVLSECDMDNKTQKERELITMCPYSCTVSVICTTSGSIVNPTKTQEEINHYNVPTAVLSECMMDNKDTRRRIVTVSLQLYCQTVLSECDVDNKDTRRENCLHYVSLQRYCQRVMWTTKDKKRELITMCPQLYCQSDVDNKKTQEERS